MIWPKKNKSRKVEQKKNLPTNLPSRITVEQLRSLRAKNSNRSKYGNVRSAYNGRTFDSKREAEWAANLDAMRFAADPALRVVEVLYQYRMPLIINGMKVSTYVADFWVRFDDGHTEVQDAKGFKTAVYRLKKKMVVAQYGITIREV